MLKLFISLLILEGSAAGQFGALLIILAAIGVYKLVFRKKDK